MNFPDEKDDNHKIEFTDSLFKEDKNFDIENEIKKATSNSSESKGDFQLDKERLMEDLVKKGINNNFELDEDYLEKQIKKFKLTDSETDDLYDYLDKNDVSIVSSLILPDNKETLDPEIQQVLLDDSIQDSKIDECIEEIYKSNVSKNQPQENLTGETESSKEVNDQLRWYLSQIENFPEIEDQDEEKELFARVSQGEEGAFDEAVNRNLRLVVSFSKKLWHVTPNPLDVIQEGNLGLMKAVKMFDYKKGFRFSTYAYAWIMQGIYRYFANNERTIRIPVHFWEKLVKIKHIQKEYSYSDFSVSSIKGIIQHYFEAYGYTKSEAKRETRDESNFEKILGILLLDSPMVSLDEKVNYSFLVDNGLANKDVNLENNKSNMYYLEDYISDNSDDIYRYAMERLGDDRIDEVLSQLNEREEEVIRLRFGLEDGKVHTLEDVGKRQNVTRERIRQIEAKALKKLRHPSRAKLLIGFKG